MAVLTLALGIGANGAIFSVVNGVVLQPLPYPDAGRLLYLAHNAPGAGFTDNNLQIAPGLLHHYQARSHTLAAIGAWRASEVTLGSHGEPRRVAALRATPGLFEVIGVPPLLGRPLEPGDETPAAPAVAVLSYGLWQQRYGSDPGIVGEAVRISGEPVTVVGVMPRGFAFPDERPQLWLNEELDRNAFGGFYLHGIARLGVRPAVCRCGCATCSSRVRPPSRSWCSRARC